MAGRRRHRFLFLCLWGLSLGAITFFGGAVSYGFFFGVTLLPVISLIYILCVYFRFKIYQELGNRSVVCGEPTDYFFVLQNEDYFAFSGVSVRLFSDFSYVEELPGDTEYELLPGDSFTYETRLVCRYRGEYEVGVKEVAVTDFLGLFRIRYSNPGAIKAIVRPRLVQLTELKSAEEIPASRPRETFGSGEQDIPVRDYTEGDSPRQIHWKASARQGKLLTRTRTDREKQGIALFCDMTRYGRKKEEYLPLENKMLEVLLALGYYYAARDTEICVCYSQGGPVRQRVRGMQDFQDFYERAAETVFGSEGEIPDLLEPAEMQEMLWNSRLLLFVLHRPDDRMMEWAERLTAGGTPAVLYVVTEEDISDYVRQSSFRKKVIPVSVREPLEGRL